MPQTVMNDGQCHAIHEMVRYATKPLQNDKKCYTLSQNDEKCHEMVTQ